VDGAQLAASPASSSAMPSAMARESSRGRNGPVAATVQGGAWTARRAVAEPRVNEIMSQ
jgi:hypothetical protein